MPLTIATWNINSLKVRLPHVLAWLAEHRVDIVCLQETKLIDAKFPVLELKDAGYRSVFAGQPTYNGVAILLRTDTVGEPADVQVNMPGLADEQKRLIALTVDGLRVVCGYIPNGQSIDSDKYAYKLRWLTALTDWLEEELSKNSALAICGDYNIAPEPRDVHDPAAWEGQVLVSAPERAAFDRLLALGLTDSFRMFDQPDRSYSWWDYRNLAFRRKQGLRIDHVLLSAALAKRCTACHIDIEPRRREQPSDHAPVIATIAS